MCQWSECARKAIDAAIYAIVKTISKLAKDFVLGLWIPGECFVEDGCIRGGQSNFPCVNVVAEGSRIDLAGDRLLVASSGCWPRIFVKRIERVVFRVTFGRQRRVHCQRGFVIVLIWIYLAYRFSQCLSIAFDETLKMYSPLYQRLRCCGPRTSSIQSWSCIRAISVDRS